MFVILGLSGLALALALLTDSQIRLGRTVENQAQAYYSALAGLEEARGRLNPSAPDAISTVPANPSEVLYLVNSSTSDPVQPTNPSSPYFDSEYFQEFPGGLSAATVLSLVPSDQPGTGTATTIPFKWVRITLKTEHSSNQDVDQDGTLDNSTPIYWDGSQQDLSTRLPHGIPIYKLTALAVGSSRVRKMVQAEVAGVGGGLHASAALAAAGSATLRGKRRMFPRNLDVDGNDACGLSNLPGILTGGTIASSSASISGAPAASVSSVSPFPQSASGLIDSLRASSIPILTADPAHVTLASGGTSYNGSDVMLGAQASGSVPAQPGVVYADKSLTIAGSAATGDGILLVSGDLTVTGAFNYQGLIVVDGTVTLASTTSGSISIRGAIVNSGDISANSALVSSSTINVRYDSCAVADSARALPKTVLASRELSF